LRATWPRAKLEEAIAVLNKSTSLDDACKRLRVGRHKLRRAFNAVGLSNPSFYLQGSPWSRKLLADIDWDKMPEIIREPQVVPREPERPKIQPPPEWHPVEPKRSPLKKPLKNEGGVRTYIVVSDVHVEYQDRHCCEAVAEFMQDTKPHGIVIAGDFLDFLELSRHNTASLLKLEGRRVSTTFSEGNLQLDEWQNAAGEQCIDNHFIKGNHEDRIDRWLASGDNGVWAGDESISIEARLRLKQRGFRYHDRYPEAGVLLGRLWVCHGRFTNRYHAAKHLDFYRHSVLYGHTHTPQVHYASALHGQQVAVGLGHLADPDSEACSYAARPNAWCQGFAAVHVRDDGAFNVQPINFWDGQFAVAGKVYGRARSTAFVGARTAFAGGAR
jgi:predicted phosphodiesterase